MSTKINREPLPPLRHSVSNSSPSSVVSSLISSVQSDSCHKQHAKHLEDAVNSNKKNDDIFDKDHDKTFRYLRYLNLRHFYRFYQQQHHQIIALILCLITSQMIMLIATKQVVSKTPFPLLLCEAQFMVSSLCARGLLVLLVWRQSSSSSLSLSTTDKDDSRQHQHTDEENCNTIAIPHDNKTNKRKSKILSSLPATTAPITTTTTTLKLSSLSLSSATTTQQVYSVLSSWMFYVPLSLSWTLGFVLFNASATYMSPSYVNLIRCGEPLATVLIGFVVLRKRYSRQVLLTLVPVLGGVWLAATVKSNQYLTTTTKMTITNDDATHHRSLAVTTSTTTTTTTTNISIADKSTKTTTTSTLSWEGILLASLSNVCFCIRPFVLHAMKQQDTKKTTETTATMAEKSYSKNDTTTNQDISCHQNKGHLALSESNKCTNKTKNASLETFFRVTALAAFAILPILVYILEGNKIRQYYYYYHHHTHSNGGGGNDDKNHYLPYSLAWNVLSACLGFFLYQYTQLQIMSVLSPLAFSILTPIIKAVMIVLCSIYFGDPLGIAQIVGVLMTTCGGYWFTTIQKKE